MEKGAKSKHVKISFKNCRISRSTDKRNWIYEELRTGGITPKTREIAPDRWVEVGYYGRLEHVIHAMLDREIEVPGGSLDTQLKAILEEIKKAEARLLEQMKVVE